MKNSIKQLHFFRIGTKKRRSVTFAQSKAHPKAITVAKERLRYAFAHSLQVYAYRKRSAIATTDCNIWMYWIAVVSLMRNAVIILQNQLKKELKTQ